MGQFNNNNGQNVKSQLLRTNVCVVCQKPGMHQSLGDPGSMSFDYVCTVCNPNVIIKVTDITLMSSLLDELRDNPSARSGLKAEISSFTGDAFKLDINILQYFLGKTKHKPVTYGDWESGKVIGDVRNYFDLSPEDLAKIRHDQKIIFDKKVTEKLTVLKNNFNDRKSKSLSVKKMISKELDDVSNIITKGKYKYEYKPTSNDHIQIGSYAFKSYVLSCIQEMYELAVSGSLDLSIIPSEKQMIGVASMDAKVDCMVWAVAFSKFETFLEDQLENLSPPQPNGSSSVPSDNDNFSRVEIHDLKKNIDDLKSLIIKELGNIEDTQYQLFYQTQSGQEVLFNELEDMKRLLPALTKKNWLEVIRGKLVTMTLNRMLTKEGFDWLMEQLGPHGRLLN